METTKLTEDYETERKNRIEYIEKLKNYSCSPIVCSYCNSRDLEYYCADHSCSIYACKKCAFKQGCFKKTKFNVNGQIIYSDDEIFWYCISTGYGIDQGFWLDEKTFISHTKTCDGCKKIFPLKILQHCVPSKDINLYKCDVCLINK